MNTTPWEDRRARLVQALRAAGGGVAVLPTAPQRARNADNDFPYRHDSNFHYLTGFDEPQAWLLLDASGAATLLCRAKDAQREIWDGLRLGPLAAPAALRVQAAFDVEALDAVLAEQLANQPAVWFVFGSSGRADSAGDRVEARVDACLAGLRARSRSGLQSPPLLRDLAPLLAEMRLIKDAGELDLMRRAAAISAGAHRRAMRFCAARFRAAPGTDTNADAGVAEYEIEAELLHEFRRHGAQSPAYESIVAAGANACVLHYAAGNTRLRAGELCLIDAGCELDGYASDITRTFPANGRFSAPQRALYDIVLAAQQAAVVATRPGARQRDAHHAAVRVLAEGLLDRRVVGDVDAVIESTAYRQFYMHGTGHWLGRDVHDVGAYLALDEAASEQVDSNGRKAVMRPSRVLRPGMVVTLEPGLYVRPAAGVPEHFWNIGIRIEDDAVVNASGCELISRGVPVRADEIEALMANENESLNADPQSGAYA